MQFLEGTLRGQVMSETPSFGQSATITIAVECNA
jgi:hypothetical protein